jgi:hypothetical protein
MAAAPSQHAFAAQGAMPPTQATAPAPPPGHHDDEDYDREPRRRRRRAKKGSSASLIIGLIIGGVLLLAFVGVIIVLIFVFARSSPEKQIIGRWEPDAIQFQPGLIIGRGTLEFTSDGKMIIQGPNGRFTLNYRFVSRNVIEVDVPGAVGGARPRLNVDIDGDSLILTEDHPMGFQGASYNFRRVH